MKKTNLKIAAIFLIFGVFTSNSFAAVISGTVTAGSGSFVELTAPFTESTPVSTVGGDNFDNPNLYAFDESQNIVLPSAINVDNLADGLGGETIGGSLPAGTVVASHYVFFDPTDFVNQQGTVTFDLPILAVLSSNTNLSATDSLLGNASVTYLGGSLRGLEGGDNVSITSLNTISVDWDASTPGDYVRVLTGIPEPSTTVLLIFGLAFLGASRMGSKGGS